MAARLFAFFRSSDANDPATFVAGATAIFAHYPANVVERVCHPMHGAAGSSKWLPSLAELREACEREMKPIRDGERRERERDRTARVLAGHKAPLGSLERDRVKDSFVRLKSELAAHALAEAASMGIQPSDCQR
jgi:hypothetical protein